MNTKIYNHPTPNHTAEKELAARTGQVVEVLRPLTAEEADLEDPGPMYAVRFADGFESHVFVDELS